MLEMLYVCLCTLTTVWAINQSSEMRAEFRWVLSPCCGVCIGFSLDEKVLFQKTHELKFHGIQDYMYGSS